MSRRFSPWNLVDRNASLEGQLTLSELPRLSNVVSSVSDARYQIDGAKDVLGQPILRVRLQGQLGLVCERCLDEMPFQLECHSSLQLKTQVQAATRSGEHELTDDCDVLIAERDDKLDAFELLQDEILLALPLVPAHTDIQECGEKVVATLASMPATNDKAETTNKPFADLANLLGKAD